MQEYLKSRGMTKVIRVGLPSGMDFMDEIGQIAGYTAEAANSLDEAEKMLDKWEAELEQNQG